MWSIALVLGVAFPGFGHAMAGRWRVGAIIAVALLGMHAVTVVTPWALVALMVARLGVAIHGAVAFRRHGGAAKWEAALGIVGICVALMVVLRIYVVETMSTASSSMAPTLQVHDHLIVSKLPHSVQRGDLVMFWYPCSRGVQYAKRVVAVAGDAVEVRCDVVYINGKAVPHEVVGHTAYLDHDDATDQWMRKEARESREELGGHHYRVYDSPYRSEVEAGQRDFPRSHQDPPSCANADDASAAPTFPTPAEFGAFIGTTVDDASCAPQMQYVVPNYAVFVLGDNRYNSNDSRVWGPLYEDAVVGVVTGIWWPDSNNGSQIGRIE